MKAARPALLLLLLGCSKPAPAPADAGFSALGADAGPDAGPLLPDPHLFDCTAAGPPARVAATPVACGLDRSCRTPQVSGHRGAGGQLGDIAPEDTLAAYRAGIVLGLDYVETDPRPTSDGVLVNLHDPTVDRTTDGTGNVADLTFAQLRALHIKVLPGALAGDFSCEKVPTLTELLQTCAGKVVVLVDANKTDRVDLLVQAIHDADALDWALFDTSGVDKLDQALALEPGLHTMIRVSSVDDLNTQLDHFAAHPPDMVEIEAGAPVAEVAAAAHARGNRVMRDVFSVDLQNLADGRDGDYAAAFAGGVDVVETDRPEHVLRYLGRR